MLFTTNITIQRPISILSNIYEIFCSFGSRAVTRTIIVLIGVHLLDKYNELTVEVVNKINSRPEKCPNVIPNAQTKIRALESSSCQPKNQTLQNFANRFHNIQECFNLFNSFSGFLILFALIDSVGSVIFHFYNTQKMFLERNYWRALRGCVTCIEHVISVYVYMLLGELSKNLVIITILI